MIPAVDRNTIRVEKARTLARVGKTDDAGSVGESAEEPASQESLKIEREIGAPVTERPPPCRRTQPSRGTTETVPWKEDRCGDPGIFLHQGTPSGKDQPSELALGPVFPDCGHHGKGVYNIPEGTRLDQKDAAGAVHDVMIP
jgi:hypothetical protein